MCQFPSRVQLFVTPWSVAWLSMEFSRQEHWSGLPFPSPGDLPKPGIESRSPTLQADSLPSEPPGKPKNLTGRLCVCVCVCVLVAQLCPTLLGSPIGSYISIIHLNVNGLNAPTKRNKLAGWMKTCVCTHLHLSHHYA